MPGCLSQLSVQLLSSVQVLTFKSCVGFYARCGVYLEKKKKKVKMAAVMVNGKMVCVSIFGHNKKYMI